MFERHTGENMFNLISDFLGVICSQWRGKLLGVGTDGASSMTGHVGGVAMHIEQAIEHKFYRVWCGLHQLDLVMKHAYADIKDKKFNKILHSLTKYLRQQHKLIADMQSTCPNATTRWTCKWLLEKRIQVLEYIAVDQKINAPEGWWWIVASAIHTLSKEINVVFVKLQSKNLLISQQAAELEKLATILCAHIIIDGPFSQEEIILIDMTLNTTFGRWSISNENLINWILD